MALSPAGKLMKSNVQKKISSNKQINIIFDLDATLISSDINCVNYGAEDPDWTTQSIGPHQRVVIPGSSIYCPQKADHNIMYYRPYAPELLMYLKHQKNINISVWSAGEQKYVEGICKVLFGPDWKTYLKIVISRKDSTPKYTSIISHTGEVFDSDFEGRSIKDLEVLFRHKKWGKIFTPKNTLLIDDAYDHYVKNQGRNITHVPAWNGYNSCDTVLFQLQQWLARLFKNSNLDMSKIPQFEITNHLGMETGNTRYGKSDVTNSLTKLDKNNRICAPKLINYYKCRDSMRKPEMNLEQKYDMLVKCTTDHLINQKPFVKHTHKSVKPSFATPKNSHSKNSHSKNSHTKKLKKN